MINANTITEQQYEDGKSELLAASELEQSGRYNARLKLDARKIGAFAMEEAFAMEDYVRITKLNRDDQGFIITVASESGAESDHRITLNGILYPPESNSTDERGYLITPPLGDLDHELEAAMSELVPARLIIQQKDEPKHFELPQPPDVDSPTHRRDFF